MCSLIYGFARIEIASNSMLYDVKCYLFMKRLLAQHLQVGFLNEMLVVDKEIIPQFILDAVVNL